MDIMDEKDQLDAWVIRYHPSHLVSPICPSNFRVNVNLLLSVLLLMIFAYPSEAKFQSASKPPLFDLEGIYTHSINSASSLAQKYFDQGMVFYYGFNFDESARSFDEAAIIDPDCPICYWGKALALRAGVNSHNPQNDPHMILAIESLQGALKLISKASPNQKAYIEALAKSYLQKGSFQDIDKVFLQEMAKVVQQYPEDLDARTLLAKAEMDTNANGEEILKNLMFVLAKDSTHPGANHYYIHAVENMGLFNEGLESAKKLEHLVPFSGHLTHMPAHIYFRLGKYHEASLANERAIKADEELFAKGGLKGDYFAGYYFHNFQFLIDSLVMEGKKNEALQITSKVLDIISKESPKLSPFMSNVFQAERIIILVRFEDLDQILKEPKPNAPFAEGMWHFARTLAFLKRNEIDKAKLEAKNIQSKKVDNEDWLNTLLNVAYFQAEAAIAEHLRDFAEMLENYSKAIQLESSIETISPPVWFQSSREALGKALIRANRPDLSERL